MESSHIQIQVKYNIQGAIGILAFLGLPGGIKSQYDVVRIYLRSLLSYRHSLVLVASIRMADWLGFTSVWGADVKAQNPQ